MAEQQRRGRRAGGASARQEIVTAAREEFAERGYDQASVRGLARRAQVDPGLVRYYFPGGKAELFTAALDAHEIDPRRVADGIVAGGVDGLGVRLVRAVLGVWDAPGGPERYRMVFAAAASGDQHALLREFLVREIFSRIAATMSGPDVAVRVSLVASHVLGILAARYVLRLEPVASAPAEELAERVGPVLQSYLDG